MGVVPQGLTPTISYLWPHHRSMARSMVAGGLTPGELAVAYGYTPGQITRIINSPLFQSELARIEAGEEQDARDLRKEIMKMAERAVEVIDEDLRIKEIGNKTRQAAAFDILDRAGFGTKKTSIHVEGDMTFVRQDIHEMSTEQLHDEVMGFIEGECVEG